MIGNQEHFTVGDIAIINDVSKKTVFLAIKRGELAAERINARVIRVHRDDVARWRALCKGRNGAPKGTSSIK